MAVSNSRTLLGTARLAILSLSIVLFGFAAVPAWTASVPFNDTGQVQCGDGTGLVSCTAAIDADDGTYPRQDARFGRDAAASASQLTKTGCNYPNGSSSFPCAAGFDFTAICHDGFANCTDPANTAGYTAASGVSNPHGGWSCTLDNVTGLTWALHPGADVGTDGAVQANAASLCGFTDWRLPQRRELVSIVDYGAQSPAIDTNYFPGSLPVFYFAAEGSWGVDLDNGSSYVGTFPTSVVRLVRGPLPATPTYTSNPDGTVTDPVTTLTWDQQAYTGCGTSSLFACDWQGALQAVIAANQANYLGHNDWRLPNVKELESLVNLATSFPALYPGTGFDPLTWSHYFWSSTPYNGAHALGVGFLDGGLSEVTSNSASVRLVRGGPFTVLDNLTTTAITNTPPLQSVYGAGFSIHVSVARAADAVVPSGGSVTCTLALQPSGPAAALPVAAVSNGLATCLVPAAQPAGAYDVVAAFTSNDSNFTNSTSSTATLTIGLAAQTITFTSAPPGVYHAGGTYTVNATGGGSGNPVTFSIDAASTPGTCTINGQVVTFAALGVCILDANQAGNANFAAAPQAQTGMGVAPDVVAVPTLSSGALLLLIGLLAGVGWVSVRRG